MKALLLIPPALALFCGTAPSTQAQSAPAPAKPAATSPAPPAGTEAEAPVVQLALLLDTSGSMEGLIEQAKGQLWRIVNEFISARQRGRQPNLEVALYEYGKSSLPASHGWIRRIVPLTNDLDRISEELFKLKTNGGEEYCGWVIRDAVEQLAWDKSPDAFKAIFIAGNEPFTQGPVDYAKACKAAIEKGIIVNTIHCGGEAVGVQTKWKDGALLAEGNYLVIDQNRAVVHFEAPQDKDIARLGVELNKTYLAFGTAGKASQERQVAQDANSFAVAAQGSSVQRALSKSSALYCNSAWDLVDACKSTNFNFSTLPIEELPVEMRPMTEVERKAYVESKAREREKIQAEIQRLNLERQRYVAQEGRERSTTNTLDSVVISTIREQAMKRNYEFR